MSRELDVLREVSLDAVQPPKAIWVDAVSIEEIHRDELAEVARSRRAIRDGGRARNIVLEGRAGAGKSHFLGRVRRDALAAGDLFVAVHLVKADDFFAQLALAYVDALFRRRPGGETQLQALLNALFVAGAVGEEEAMAAVAGIAAEGDLATVRRGIGRMFRSGASDRTAADVVLALVLLNSEDPVQRDVGFALFEGLELDDDQRIRTGIRARSVPAIDVVRALDTIVGRAGLVTVVALDQLDGLLAVAWKAMGTGDKSVLNVVANDLMTLAESAERTLVVLSCMRASWALIEAEAVQSVRYRFPDRIRLGELPSAGCGERLIGEVLSRSYARQGFVPPYPTWPVRGEAFAAATDFTPRGLILQVEKHISNCVREGRVVELRSLEAVRAGPAVAPPRRGPRPMPVEALDARFETLRAEHPVPALTPEGAEATLVPLLYSALTAFVGERTEGVFRVDDAADWRTSNPPLNARLRQILDAEREDEIHWCFRVLFHPNGRAQHARLQGATIASGLGPQRVLIVLRNGPWSPGARTQRMLEVLRERGGAVANVPDDDLATLVALHTLIGEVPDGLGTWLRTRRPTRDLALLAPVAAALARSDRATDGGRPGDDPPADPHGAPDAAAASDDATAGSDAFAEVRGPTPRADKGSGRAGVGGAADASAFHRDATEASAGGNAAASHRPAVAGDPADGFALDRDAGDARGEGNPATSRRTAGVGAQADGAAFHRDAGDARVEGNTDTSRRPAGVKESADGVAFHRDAGDARVEGNTDTSRRPAGVEESADGAALDRDAGEAPVAGKAATSHGAAAPPVRRGFRRAADGERAADAPPQHPAVEGESAPRLRARRALGAMRSWGRTADPPAAGAVARPEPAATADGPPSWRAGARRAGVAGAARPNGARPEAATVPSGHILLGTVPGTGRPVALALEDMRRHLAVFAGTGSGKTVLLRRIVEAAALEGVSSIVLDPNNDLARLGTPRTGTAGWLPGDAALAARYHAEVDVAIWTPRLPSGRPLAFAPLAGLAAVAADPDAFELALDCAVDLIAPRARLPATTARGLQGRAVLKQALARYVRAGNTTLEGLFGYLAALPDGTSTLESGQRLAAAIAEQLKAEAIIDPMFSDRGEAVDPAVLLAPPPGRRARVSVVSFAGLPNLDQQQQFVAQLALAVFAHVRSNPETERPLGALFVMDEAQNFAASGSASPSLAPTLALASQARKYGLGLVFATQAPKGLHNRVVGNCATQLLGFLNTSAQIAAARELAAAKGSSVPDIAKLRPGQFYVAGEDIPLGRVDTPFCLTEHPRSPLTRDEVLALAAAR